MLTAAACPALHIVSLVLLPQSTSKQTRKAGVRLLSLASHGSTALLAVEVGPLLRPWDESSSALQVRHTPHQRAE